MRHEFFSKNDISVPEIDYMGYSSDVRVTGSGGKRIERQYIIHFVISGKGYFNGNQVKAGEGFVIPINTLAEWHPDEKKPWAYLWIVSTDKKMDAIYEIIGADKKTGIFEYGCIDTVSHIANKFLPHERKILPSTLISEYFLHIFNATFLKESKDRVTLKDYFDFAIKYIEVNLHTDLTVNSLCELLGITQPYLYRIFKERSSVSPKQYIDTCRINKAKNLLKTTNLTVSQVALSVGMPDSLAFSKFFSKNVGVSPSAYKKQAD